MNAVLLKGKKMKKKKRAKSAKPVEAFAPINSRIATNLYINIDESGKGILLNLNKQKYLSKNIDL